MADIELALSVFEGAKARQGGREGQERDSIWRLMMRL
jgi:hypothetical protein